MEGNRSPERCCLCGLTGGSGQMSVSRPPPGASRSGVLSPEVRFSASKVGDLCSGCLRSPEPGEMRGLGLCYASKTPGPDPVPTKVLSTLWRWRKPLESRPGEPGRREPQLDEKSQKLSWSHRTSRETHPCPARARPQVARGPWDTG